MVLTPHEYAKVQNLKYLDILNHIPKRRFSQNGGCSLKCSDGDTDMQAYHREAVSHRPHSVALFGGPLLIVPSFRNYNEVFADLIMDNLIAGMMSKETSTFFGYFDYPCAMAKKYHHSVDDVFHMIPEAYDVLTTRYRMKNIESFFHIKRINRGGYEEQSSYLIDMKKLRAFLLSREVCLEGR